MADYLTILENVPRPKLRDSVLHGAWKVYALVTSAAAAVAGAVLQLMGVVVPGRVFLWVAALVLAATILVALFLYARDWWRYIRTIEGALNGVRRKLLIHAEWQEDAPGPAVRIPMLQVALDEGSGTVRIIVQVVGGIGIRVGSKLALILSATNEVWGSLVVSAVHEGYAWADPLDRRKPELWKALEERAGSDPAPPAGFHLEADIPEFLRYEPAS